MSQTSPQWTPNRTQPGHLLILTEQVIHPLVQPVFQVAGIYTREVHHSAALLQAIWTMAVDILVIESTPPHHRVGELCQYLRRFFQFPIVVVELQANEQERIALLDVGVDDIIAIERGLAELPFRCRMLQRRRARQLARDPDSQYLCAVSLRLDIPRCRLLLPSSVSIDLTPTQTRLIALLLSAQGACVPLATIDAQVFGGRASRIGSKVASVLRDLEQRSRPYVSKPLIDHVRGHGYRIIFSESPGSSHATPSSALSDS